MQAKKVKRMCSVKGCRNTDTYAISRIKEFGGVIICKACLEEALKATGAADKQTAERKQKKSQPLFYHPQETVAKKAETKEAPGKGSTGGKNTGKKGTTSDEFRKVI